MATTGNTNVGGVIGTGGLSNITNSLTAFLNTTTGKVVVFGFLFVVITIAVVMYFYTNNVSPELNKFINQMTGKAVTSPDESNTEAKHATLYLFKVEWCPHCKTAEPVFKEVEEAINGEKIKGYNIKFVVIDCEADPTMADKYNVSGYPTIKLDKQGEIIEYDAKPDKANLKEFLEKVLSPS